MRLTNVVVVGAGPVGMVTALSLARAGLDVTLVDAQERPSVAPHDMIHRWSTLPVFERLGVLEDMVAGGVVTRQWCYRILRTEERIIFDLDFLAADVAHPFNLHLPQEDLSAVLLRHLAQYPRAEVLWGVRVHDVVQDAEGVTVLASSADGPQVLRAGWMVGADGAQSVVRRSLGLGFAGMTWPERLVSLTLDVNFADLGYLPTTYQLDPQLGALVGQVDPAGRWRYVYAENRMLPEGAILDRMPAALTAALPPGVEHQTLAWSAYRVHERAADQLRVGRVLLAGDAAHVTNPTGSFGLAGGLFDAVAAANSVAMAVEAADGGLDEILNRYAEERARFFRSVASPHSSKTMQLVFHADSATQLDEDVEFYRHIAAQPDRLRLFLLQDRDGLPVI